MFGADLFLTPFMEFQVRTVTKLSGIKKIWKIYLLDFSNRVFLPLTRGGLISVRDFFIDFKCRGCYFSIVFSIVFIAFCFTILLFVLENFFSCFLYAFET